MAKRLLPADFRVTQDDGTPATDAVLEFLLGGTLTPATVYSDPDLSASLSDTVNCDATGYPASGGDDVSIWGADTVTYDVKITATGYNGGFPKTIENIALADTTVSGATDTELDFKNALANGAFGSWSNGTSFSDISGDGDGDPVADGWFFTQPAAASNEISQQAGSAVGAAPARARYGLRFGRPAASTSTNELRLWSMLATDECYRLRGQTVTVSFTAKAGANFSASGVSIRLATGTTEAEDGDLIDSGGFGGHANPIDEAQAVTTSAERFEFTVTLGSTIKEAGLQFSYIPTGTAGANDWVQIEDVQIEIADAASSFQHIPEPVDFMRANLSALGRNFLSFAEAAPGADRGVFWDHSALDFQFFTLGTGLSYSATTLSLAATLVDVAGLTPTDNGVIIGDGANFTVESGSTLRSSVGLAPSDILTYLLTVDGASSGLDADLLDGKEASAFPLLASENIFSTTDAGDFTAIALRNLSNGGSAFTSLYFGNDAGATRAGFYLNSSANTAAAGAGSFQIGTFGAIPVGFVISGALKMTLDTSGGLNARVSTSSETTGTLTSASANDEIYLTGGITNPNSVFSQGDKQRLYAGSASRTLTQGSGVTQRLHGTSTTGNLTLAARGWALQEWISASEVVISGDVS
jgi:hypothetical protein